MYALSEGVVEFLVEKGLEEHLVDADLQSDLRHRERASERDPGGLKFPIVTVHGRRRYAEPKHEVRVTHRRGLEQATQVKDIWIPYGE